MRRGGEADSSYYIQNEFLVRDRENIDLAIDPPPDLVLEVEYSSSAIDKLSLYASMGIPELWRFDGRVLRVYTLVDRQYSEVEFSPTFEPILVQEIPHFIQQSKIKGENAITRDFRAFVKQQISVDSRAMAYLTFNSRNANYSGRS